MMAHLLTIFNCVCIERYLNNKRFDHRYYTGPFAPLNVCLYFPAPITFLMPF